MGEIVDIRYTPGEQIDPEDATIDLSHEFEQVKSTPGWLAMGACNLFEIKLLHLLVPFEHEQSEIFVDLWVHSIPNIHISYIHVVILKCGTAMVLIHVWSSNINLVKMKVLLKPFRKRRANSCRVKTITSPQPVIV